MSAKRRRRQGEVQWRELLGRFEPESDTVAEFCVREDVSPESFYRWRTRLAGQSSQIVRTEHKAGKATSLSGCDASFVDLGSFVPKASSDPIGTSIGTSTGLLLRLELGGGVVLQITRA